MECRRRAEEACRRHNEERRAMTNPVLTEIGKPQREHEIIPMVEPVPSREEPAILPDYDPEPVTPEYVPEPQRPLVPA